MHTSKYTVQFSHLYSVGQKVWDAADVYDAKNLNDAKGDTVKSIYLNDNDPNYVVYILDSGKHAFEYDLFSSKNEMIEYKREIINKQITSLERQIQHSESCIQNCKKEIVKLTQSPWLEKEINREK